MSLTIERSVASENWAFRCQRKLFLKKRFLEEDEVKVVKHEEKLIKLTCKVTNGDLTQTKTAIANMGKIT